MSRSHRIKRAAGTAFRSARRLIVVSRVRADRKCRATHHARFRCAPTEGRRGFHRDTRSVGPAEPVPDVACEMRGHQRTAAERRCSRRRTSNAADLDAKGAAVELELTRPIVQGPRPGKAPGDSSPLKKKRDLVGATGFEFKVWRFSKLSDDAALSCKTLRSRRNSLPSFHPVPRRSVLGSRFTQT